MLNLNNNLNNNLKNYTVITALNAALQVVDRINVLIDRINVLYHQYI
jgi:hypothetical protein